MKSRLIHVTKPGEYAGWQLILYWLSGALCIVLSVLSFRVGENLFRAHPILSCLFGLFVWSIDKVAWDKVISAVRDLVSDFLFELSISDSLVVWCLEIILLCVCIGGLIGLIFFLGQVSICNLV